MTVLRIIYTDIFFANICMHITLAIYIDIIQHIHKYILSKHMYTVHVSGSSHTFNIDNTNEHNIDNTIVLADLSIDLYIYIYAQRRKHV